MSNVVSSENKFLKKPRPVKPAEEFPDEVINLFFKEVLNSFGDTGINNIQDLHDMIDRVYDGVCRKRSMICESKDNAVSGSETGTKYWILRSYINDVPLLHNDISYSRLTLLLSKQFSYKMNNFVYKYNKSLFNKNGSIDFKELNPILWTYKSNSLTGYNNLDLTKVKFKVNGNIILVEFKKSIKKIIHWSKNKDLLKTVS